MSNASAPRTPNFRLFLCSATIILISAIIFTILAISCHWSNDAAQWIIATGTWLGSLFTSGAFLFGAIQLTHTIRLQHTAEERRRNELEQIARSCAFRIKPGKPIPTQGDTTRYSTLEVSFTNKTNTVIQDISVHLTGRRLAFAKQVNPGANPWVDFIEIKDLTNQPPYKAHPLTEREINGLIAEIKPKIYYRFQIGGLTFKRKGNNVTLEESENQ